MKKYIQPTSSSVALNIETTLMATSDFNIDNGGTDADPLSIHKNGWNSEDWSTEEEEF